MYSGSCRCSTLVWVFNTGVAQCITEEMHNTQLPCIMLTICLLYILFTICLLYTQATILHGADAEWQCARCIRGVPCTSKHRATHITSSNSKHLPKHRQHTTSAQNHTTTRAHTRTTTTSSHTDTTRTNPCDTTTSNHPTTTPTTCTPTCSSARVPTKPCCDHGGTQAGKICSEQLIV